MGRFLVVVVHLVIFLSKFLFEMPKKFTGENSKVAEARSRKEAARSAEQKKKEAAAADEYWKDDDKGTQKKLQRKDDKEKKRLEALARKAELKTLADEEIKSIKTEPKQAAHKITRLQIQAEVEKREAAARGSAVKPVVLKTVDSEPIPENVNRLVVEGEVARTVDEAISVLRISDSAAEAEKHPEKRMKAAFTAYEEKHLPQLRKENPNMRLSQVKQLLHR